MLKHTPFFICTLTVGVIVHLSAYAATLHTESQQNIKERIGLSLGALKAFKSIWPVADVVMNNVRKVAEEVMATQPPLDQQIWESGPSQEQDFSPDVLGEFLFDELQDAFERDMAAVVSGSSVLDFVW